MEYHNFVLVESIVYSLMDKVKQRSDNEMKWSTLSTEQLINRPWLKARRDTVQLPNGKVYDEYYILSYPTWINVIAETEDGELILERQYRHGLGVVSTEICAGVVEEGETPLQAAQRELEEETGYTGGEWEEIMIVSANPSIMDNLCHCFYARNVKKTNNQKLDDTEDIEVFLRSKEEVKEMLFVVLAVSLDTLLFSTVEVLLDVEVIVSSVFVSEVTSSFLSSCFLSSVFFVSSFLSSLLPVTLVSGFLFWLFVCVTFGLLLVALFVTNT